MKISKGCAHRHVHTWRMGKPIGDLRTLVRYPTGYAVFEAEPADVAAAGTTTARTSWPGRE